MGSSDDPQYEARGLSTTQVLVMFLAAVAVCAVFFSAGFLVGYNERVSKATPLTERVTGPAEIPPSVTREPFGAASSSSPSAISAPQDRLAPSADELRSPLRPEPVASAISEGRGPEPKLALEARTPPVIGSPPKIGASKPGAEVKEGGVPPRETDGGAAATFIIQVAATSAKPDAQKMVGALASLGYPVYLVAPEQAHAGDNLYRIQVGPFATRESAEKVRNRLVLDGFKQPFIKH